MYWVREQTTLSVEQRKSSLRKSLNNCILLRVTVRFGNGIVQLSDMLLLFNHLKAKRILLYLKTQSVPHSKHFSSRL